MFFQNLGKLIERFLPPDVRSKVAQANISLDQLVQWFFQHAGDLSKVIAEVVALWQSLQPASSMGLRCATFAPRASFDPAPADDLTPLQRALQALQDATTQALLDAGVQAGNQKTQASARAALASADLAVNGSAGTVASDIAAIQEATSAVSAAVTG